MGLAGNRSLITAKKSSRVFLAIWNYGSAGVNGEDLLFMGTALMPK
ncbi:hypothetical protein N9B10_04130 [Pirellulales bacterium]|nr:hypothetical protein [Pirellulales bacterium]